MVLLRATSKLLRSLPALGAEAPASDTALGDWYVNRVIVDRRPLLLFVSSRSLLPMLAPARQVRTLPDRLADLVADRLVRLGVAPQLIAAEVRVMTPVLVAKTADRSVVGSMIDFAKLLPSYLPIGNWNLATLYDAEERLAEAPCRVSDHHTTTIWPQRAAPNLLAVRWHAT